MISTGEDRAAPPARRPGGPPPEDAGDACEKSGGPRHLRRDAEANRQQILDAAGRLMAERGLATPLEDIATAAGVGIGTLYRRFPRREDLIEALFEERVQAFLDYLQKALSMPDGWQAMVWFLTESTSRQIEDRALKEVIERDAGPDTLRRLRERVVPLAEEVVGRAKATGRLRADFTVTDLVLLQRMLVDVGAATAPCHPDAWRRYLGLVLDGLVPGRRTPTALEVGPLDPDELDELFAGPKAPPGD